MRFPVIVLFVLMLVGCDRRKPAAASPESAPASAAAEPAAAAPSTAQPATATTPNGATPAAMVSAPDGKQLFLQNCATCHMANGSGVPYLQPSIRGSAWLSAEDPQPLLSLILRGSAVLGEGANAYENDMAPFAHLSDAAIAALATHARERFATPPPAKPITPADVALARQRPGMP